MPSSSSLHSRMLVMFPCWKFVGDGAEDVGGATTCRLLSGIWVLFRFLFTRKEPPREALRVLVAEAVWRCWGTLGRFLRANLNFRTPRFSPAPWNLTTEPIPGSPFSLLLLGGFSAVYPLSSMTKSWRALTDSTDLNPLPGLDALELLVDLGYLFPGGTWRLHLTSIIGG